MKKIKIILAVLLVAAFATTSLLAETIPRGPYFIKSVKSGNAWSGVWDVPGTPRKFKKGQNIKVWDLTRQDSRSKDRHFYIIKERNGYYRIKSGLGSRAYLNVDGNRTKNGTNIELWSKKRGSNAAAQLFRFVHLGGGRYKIYTKSGKIICLAGRSERNGSNVHIWDNHNGPWCEWNLIKKSTRQTYVPQSSYSSPNKGRSRWTHPNKRNSSATDVTLDLVFRMSKNDFRADKYFKTVDYLKLRKENSMKNISSRLNRLDGAKTLNWVLKIVDNAAQNRSTSTRILLYNEISKVNFAKATKSFVNRLLGAGVKKHVNNVYKKERNRRCKAALERIKSKL